MPDLKKVVAFGGIGIACIILAFLFTKERAYADMNPDTPCLDRLHNGDLHNDTERDDISVVICGNNGEQAEPHEESDPNRVDVEGIWSICPGNPEEDCVYRFGNIAWRVWRDNRIPEDYLYLENVSGFPCLNCGWESYGFAPEGDEWQRHSEPNYRLLLHNQRTTCGMLKTEGLVTGVYFFNDYDCFGEHKSYDQPMHGGSEALPSNIDPKSIFVKEGFSVMVSAQHNGKTLNRCVQDNMWDLRGDYYPGTDVTLATKMDNFQVFEGTNCSGYDIDQDGAQNFSSPVNGCLDIPFGGVTIFSENNCHGYYINNINEISLLVSNSLEVSSLHIESGWSVMLYDGNGNALCAYVDVWNFDNLYFPNASVPVQGNVKFAAVNHDTNCGQQDLNSDGADDDGIIVTPPDPVKGSPSYIGEPGIPADAWIIEYFNDINDPGGPVGGECHSEWTQHHSYVFRDWGDSSPGGSCNADFTARIHRNIHLRAGTYNFALFADDKARFELWHAPGGNLIVDQWSAIQHYESRTLPEGNYEFVITYRDTGGNAKVKLWWNGPDYPAYPRDVQDPQQWYAEYWPTRGHWWDPVATVNEGLELPLVREWGTNSVGYQLPRDNFSTQFRRRVDFECGRYIFEINGDDRVHLIVDPDNAPPLYELQVSRANNPVSSASPVFIPGGPHIIQLKHEEDGGDARLFVNWTLVESCPQPPTPEPTPTPIPTATPLPPTPSPIVDGDILTSFEDGINDWFVHQAADSPGTDIAQTTSHVTDGAFALRLAFDYDSSIHSRAYYQYSLSNISDWSVYDTINFEAWKDGQPMQVALVVATGQWVWHESSPQSLVDGNNTVEFDLKGSNWNGSNLITNLDYVRYIGILVYPGASGPGDLFIDNIRLGPSNSETNNTRIYYEYVEGAFNQAPDFDSFTNVVTGTIANFDLSVRQKDDDFAFQFTSCIDVPADGLYTFYTTSDDGSKLYVDGHQVVDNDGLHGAQEQNGTISLSSGKHSILVVYFERTGGELLEVRYEGPGIVKQRIPDTMLSTTGCSFNVPAASSDILTSFEDGINDWFVHQAADSPGTDIAQTTSHVTDGAFALRLAFDYDSSIHSRAYYQYSLSNISDWSVYDTINFEAWKDGQPMQVALVVATGQWVWHESSPQSLVDGNNTVEFDLKGSNWNGSNPITNLDNVRYIGILVYPNVDGPGDIFIDNIRLLTGNVSSTTVDDYGTSESQNIYLPLIIK